LLAVRRALIRWARLGRLNVAFRVESLWPTAPPQFDLSDLWPNSTSILSDIRRPNALSRLASSMGGLYRNESAISRQRIKGLADENLLFLEVPIVDLR
jgi:hypothetical protein